MVVYSSCTNKAEALSAVETAPACASPDMFPDRTSSKYGILYISSDSSKLEML